MFEFDKYDSKKPGIASRPEQAYQHFPGGFKRALVLWGEHCVECAAPDCFVTCDLYASRPDERCRRFEYGIFRNKNYLSAAGYGAEVIFRRWGKLEARGNATMLPLRFSYFLENCILTLLPLLNLLGRSIRQMGADIRWSYISFALLERLNRAIFTLRDPRSKPDAFVAEIYNPTEKSVALVFSIVINRAELSQNLLPDQLPKPFSKRLNTKPGYNRFDITASNFTEIIESRLPFSMVLLPDSEDGSHLVFLCLDLVQYNKIEQSSGNSRSIESMQKKSAHPAKCVVFDLDNTLWDGILLEGQVVLRPNIGEIFAELDERGILISVISKNSREDAIAKLAEYGLKEYLLYPMINWNQKSNNIKNIAEKIGIGLDTFIFIDDNLFEREEVSNSHPEVEVLPDSALDTLLEQPRLQGNKTPEAKQRRLMYQQTIDREEVEIKFGDNYMEFLRDCEIVIEISPVTEKHLDRVIELVQRTNQLNFSGRKYSRVEITEIINAENYSKHAISCRDKYGFYGIIGFCLSKQIRNRIFIEDFMLSCRVQGKLIEQAFFDYLVSRSIPQATILEINFHKTERNGPAQAVLKKLGFLMENETVLSIELKPGDLSVDFLAISDLNFIDKNMLGGD